MSQKHVDELKNQLVAHGYSSDAIGLILSFYGWEASAC